MEREGVGSRKKALEEEERGGSGRKRERRGTRWGKKRKVVMGHGRRVCNWQEDVK